MRKGFIVNVATKINPVEEPTDLVAKALENPVALFTDAAKFSDFYARVKAETDKLTPDTSTNKGRDEIRSMARKVVTTKTTLDKAAKKLTEGWREQTNQVNAARNKMVADLAALAEEVRKPLTEWEAAEEARVDRANNLITEFKLAAVFTNEDTSATIRARGKTVFEIELTGLGDMLDAVQAAKDHAIGRLKDALAHAIKEEADRAELEKLRAEAADRAEADRVAAEQAEAVRAEAERIEAEKRRADEAKAESERQAKLAEERRVAAQKAEADRIANAERMAAERAQREAEEAARAEHARRDAEHEVAISAERARAEAAERAAQAERETKAKEDADRAAKAKAEADAQAKREADQRHRNKVKTEAKIAIMATGKDVSDEAAVLIVKAIVAGSIPHTSLRF